jgi:hypothetical protein
MARWTECALISYSLRRWVAAYRHSPRRRLREPPMILKVIPSPIRAPTGTVVRRSRSGQEALMVA